MAGALSGLKIVELGEMVSAPYAAKLMADMGAEVIKIERPGAGDGARLRGPFPGGESHREKSGLYLYLNSNKVGVTLDVSRPEGLELLERLAADADVLIHNLVPSDMDRIGLTFERLHNRNPRLVMTSISPWGLSGPKREWRAEDLTLWSASGLCYVNGGGPEHPEMPPLRAFGQQAGFQGGVHAAVATMGDAKAFKSGREFAAWLGLVPRQTGTGGRVRLLGISKRGDRYLRTLLIHGARAVLTHSKAPPEWLTELVKRRPKNVAVVAMANKMARTIWALMAHERAYQIGYVSRPA